MAHIQCHHTSLKRLHVVAHVTTHHPRGYIHTCTAMAHYHHYALAYNAFEIAL